MHEQLKLKSKIEMRLEINHRDPKKMTVKCRKPNKLQDVMYSYLWSVL